MNTRPGGRALLIAALTLSIVTAPLVAAQGERLVSQSLWGVRQSVGLGVVETFVTNVGDRAFYEARPTGAGVRVAVIDTGLDPDHPDLQGVLACDDCWRDFVGQGATPYDDHGHGTHVAGIVAGRGHFQVSPLSSYFPTGARGMAPGAELLVAKAVNDSGSGDDRTVAEAVRWALDPDGQDTTNDGAHIIHLSLGIQAPPGVQEQASAVVRAGSETERAVAEAIDEGVLVVMSAGNQGQQGPAPPGEVEGVIAVGALDASGRPLAFSNHGPGVDVYAPGVITSTWPKAHDRDGIRDGYTGLAGTSQAAPVVTGALALALEANPALRDGGATKVAHVEDLVRRTGAPAGADGTAVGLDAAALLAQEDRGADDVAWTVVAVLGALGLLVAALVARTVLRLLGRHHKRHRERTGAAEREAPDEGATASGADGPGPGAMPGSTGEEG